MAAVQLDEPSANVRFTTRLEPSLRVTEAPIQLPVRLTRYGLSEVVNHLLGAAPPRPFDFLLQGELLRGSLGKAMARLALSGEEAVTLEYIELLAPPQPQAGAAHDDWVAALASQPDGGLLLTGCYDHAAYACDAAGRRVATLAGHDAPVKGVAWLQPAGGGGAARAATASKDHTVRTWRVDGETSACESIGSGHDDAVECLCANPAGSRLCSGGWDGQLLLWSGAEPAPGAAPAAPPPAAKRSRKAAAAAEAPAELSAVARLTGHHDCVAAVCWPTATMLYSAGWDGAVKAWDAGAEACTTTLPGQKAVASLSVSLLSALIATGHADHNLRVWDARLDKTALAFGPAAHKGWVTGVAWSAHRAELLLSSCHDGSVKLWDTRSTVPLHELPPHSDKALCVAWHGVEHVASGGADGQLKVSSLRLPSA